MNQQPLPRREWDFDAVPDSELVACCYWEYARESATIREVYKHSTEPDFWDDTNPFYNNVLNGLGRVFDCRERHLRSGVFRSDFYTNHLFPATWQILKEAERRRMSDPRWIQPGPGLSSVGKVDAYQISHEYNDKTKKWKCIVRDSVLSHYGIELTVLEINWRDYTDEALTHDFQQWLKEKRPKNLPKTETKRGHSLKEWRANLTRLAVMRLLCHFPPLQLIDPQQDKFPAVWETNQFARHKWHDVTKWYDARREAGKLFHKLFPFLPKEEKPLSWNRLLPGK